MTTNFYYHTSYLHLPSFYVGRKKQIIDMEQRIELIRYARVIAAGGADTLQSLESNPIFKHLPEGMRTPDLRNVLVAIQGQVHMDEYIQKEHDALVLTDGMSRFARKHPIVLAYEVRRRLSPIRRDLLDWYVDEHKAGHSTSSLHTILHVHNANLTQMFQEYARICVSAGPAPRLVTPRRRRVRTQSVFQIVPEFMHKRLTEYTKMRIMGRKDIKPTAMMPELVGNRDWQKAIANYVRSQMAQLEEEAYLDSRENGLNVWKREILLPNVT